MRQLHILRDAIRSPRRLIYALALTCMLILISALSGQTFDQAFFPTQNNGNRGVDVQAIQLLLRQHGSDISADGIFGPITESAVTTFQSSAGITVDGIVGPQTWSRLIVTVRPGSTGEAVKAVQMLLNEKRGAGLTLDGIFGPNTESAVRTFQEHAGITVDSIVGPVTWENLLWHYEQPNVDAESMCGYRDPDARWGTAATIGQLEAAANEFYATGNGPVAIGDISLEHGGEIEGHGSHEVGLDVDLRPIRTDSMQCDAGCVWTDECYDRDATRELVKAIRAKAEGHVMYVFFNDPVLIDEGLTNEEPNHDDHLHVRYCEVVHPNEAIDYRCN